MENGLRGSAPNGRQAPEPRPALTWAPWGELAAPGEPTRRAGVQLLGESPTLPRVRIARALGRAILILATIASAGCGGGVSQPRNIILIVVDTLRRDYVSPYGSTLSTPNVQRLADRGQVFSNAVASYHQTTMSMAALFTGRTPSTESGNPKKSLSWSGRHWCGMARFADGPDDSCVPQGMTTLAEDLREAGYSTLAVVSNRLLFAPAGFDQGFDRWIEVAARQSDLAPEILARHRSAKRVHTALERALQSPPHEAFRLRVPLDALFLFRVTHMIKEAEPLAGLSSTSSCQCDTPRKGIPAKVH